MGLFDIIKDKAAELLSGASDKVKDLTGAELPGAEVADKLSQPADNVGQDVTDAAQDVTGSASEAAKDAIPDETDPNSK